MNSCIFCLEGGDLVHNVKCRCNFCFHLACYEKYNRKTICPMCRGTVGDLYVPQVEIQEQEPAPIVVHVDTFQTQQSEERCRRRSKTAACVACVGVCSAICIVILRFFVANN